MKKILYSIVTILVLPLSNLCIAGGIGGDSGTVGKKLEIIAMLGEMDTSTGSVFIADDKFIELIGVFGLAELKEWQKNSAVSIQELMVKDGITAIKGLNFERESTFVIFSESQKPLIKNVKATVDTFRINSTTAFVLNND